MRGSPQPPNIKSIHSSTDPKFKNMERGVPAVNTIDMSRSHGVTQLIGKTEYSVRMQNVLKT